MATLYVVATPIGNLKDITLRALETLKEADLILCEDTRVTKKLLARYDIRTHTESYHTKSRFSKTEKIIRLLKDGKNLALVTDSGTPAISDPGSHLVSLIREKAPEAAVVAVPGPNAAVAALSIAGLPASEFLFLGFLPHKKGRETLFREVASLRRTVVFYESPHRIIKTLEALERHVENRKVVVARELTKVHEELISGYRGEVLQFLHDNPGKVRGEFVVIVEGR